MRRRITALAASIVLVATAALVMVLRPAYAAMACAVDYQITREWSRGWLADLTVRNLGTPATGWWLRFRMPGAGQQLTLGIDQLPPGFRLIMTEIYPTVVLVPPEGSTLPTGGAVTVRFGGFYRDANPAPIDYVFNDQPCNVDLPATSPPRSSPPPEPSPGPAPPSVKLTAPEPNDFFVAPATVPIRADAVAAPGRQINRVEFRAAGTLLHVDTTAPYAFDWRGVPPDGGTRITATAYDHTGATATAEVRGVRVIPPAAPGAAPALTMSGNRVVTVERDPRPYRPRGLIRSTLEVGCVPGPGIWDGPVDDASVRALRARGVTAVRMLLSGACWDYTDGVTPRADRNAYLAEAATYARRLISHGITPIVALRPTATMSVRDFWTAAALRFGEDNAVVFDLVDKAYPAVSATDPTTAWTCWRDGGADCVALGHPATGVRELVRLIRLYGAFNLVLAGGLDRSNDLSGWMAYRPADPDGRSLAAAWHVDNRSACATPACWRATLVPLVAHVPVVATEVSADADAPGFVPRTVSWLDRHGIGHLRR